jgi:hypothetical protein
VLCKSFNRCAAVQLLLCSFKRIMHCCAASNTPCTARNFKHTMHRVQIQTHHAPRAASNTPCTAAQLGTHHAPLRSFKHTMHRCAAKNTQ